MSLGLHDKCKQQLSEKIAEQLANINVQNRKFLDRKSSIYLFLAESVLPRTGKLKGRLEQYISETPIFDFVYETLSKELYEKQEFDSDTPLIKLIEIDDYKNSKEVAQRLVSDFESLPWEYTLFIKLPNGLGKFFSEHIKERSLSDSVKIITPNDDFAKKFPLQSGIEARDQSLAGGLGLFVLGKPQEWDPESGYLQVNVSGFIGRYGDTAPLEVASSLFKAFCGLAIALRLLTVSYKYRPTPSKEKFFIHRKVGERWEIERKHELEVATSDTYLDLVLHDLEGRLETDAKKVAWVRRILGLISCVFSNESKSRKLLLGSQWLFDSYCGKNELLSFVQTAVVLEILLGEKAVSDIMGLGELLRNRCAYLIGESHKQRQEILKEFKDIYDVRSGIVHQGKSRLNLHERSLFSKLQWMCRRVIQEEVDLLKEDLKENA